jgi:hypothetical protein
MAESLILGKVIEKFLDCEDEHPDLINQPVLVAHASEDAGYTVVEIDVTDEGIVLFIEEDE